MRKGLLFFVIVLVIGIISSLVYFSTRKLSEKEDRQENISLLPLLKFSSIEGREINLRNEYNGRKVILILFNSECEHCIYEAESISENLSSFSNSSLVFLSMEPLEKVIDFSATASLQGKDNVTFGQADYDELESIFKGIRYPNIFIYDADGSLVKEFKGETKVDLIVESLEG